ncbi:hypothetical protein LCGC14_1261760 [marine sediment metagenome]|uniref:Yeast cell wall synthesis Kre9/Knh1-like N-terminal domain-containing protein n=1 Tax=marine sediment metagenome TaxID=412755 RepID=A0A0F9NH55_9ZZZZ|nr:MAG: hypothetical protein Lokiarch_21270 [Candidatus Lokiarchaeum sp. GC14_75]
MSERLQYYKNLVCIKIKKMVLMKNKKIVFGIVIFLFAITGIYDVSNAFVDEFTLSPVSYGGYSLGNLDDGDIIKINEVDSSDTINVYIMNDDQYDILVNSGGLTWNYFIRWKDITYLSGLTFDITIDDHYFIIFYNKGLLFSRTVKVDISVEYKSIIITSPKSTGIYVFESGNNYITWTSTGNFDYVKIDLYEIGVYLETIANSVANDGSYAWYIYDDEYIDGSNYQIKISDYYDSNIFDYSDYFTIDCETEIEKTITITSPTSTDTFLPGHNYITWTTTGPIDYVRIRLYDGSNFLETIESSAYNDGSYDWYLSSYETYEGSNYRIEISDYDDNLVYTFSNYFTIEIEQGNNGVSDVYIQRIFWTALLSIIISAAVILTTAVILIHKRRRQIPKEIIPFTKEIPVKEEPVKSQERELPRITYCSSCGAEILDRTGNFCLECGAPIK